MLYWQGCQISSHRIEKQIKYEQNFIIRNIISSTILITAEVIEKHSPTLNRDTEYTKTMAISRLPGYMTIQMVRWVLWYINHLQQTLEYVSFEGFISSRRRQWTLRCWRISSFPWCWTCSTCAARSCRTSWSPPEQISKLMRTGWWIRYRNQCHITS